MTHTTKSIVVYDPKTTYFKITINAQGRICDKDLNPLTKYINTSAISCIHYSISNDKECVSKVADSLLRQAIQKYLVYLKKTDLNFKLKTQQNGIDFEFIDVVVSINKSNPIPIYH